MDRPARAIARRPNPPGKRRAPIPTTPRQAAFDAVAAHAERFPDLLPAQPACDGLDARDAALAHALYEATLRRWRTLAFLLDTRLRRPMRRTEPRLQAALLVGAAQLLLMDRVPDHAAINESVQWAKAAVRPGAAKLVNAVLRALVAIRAEREQGAAPQSLDRRDAIPLSSGDALRLTEPLLPEDDAERTALAVGLPKWLVSRWFERYGPGPARDFCLQTLVVAPVVVNATHAGAPLGAIADWPAHEERGFRVAPPGADVAAALAGRADLWVQDPGSAGPIASLPDLGPRLVVDACAGLGTKTRQLAHRFPDATVVASDTDPARTRALHTLAAELPNMEVCDPAELPYRHTAAADLVVLDVPCTNTGVLSRRVEARHRCSQRQLERLADVQRQIIADSIRLLAPSARLLYSACSLEPEECAAHAEWAGRWHALSTLTLESRTPTGAPGGPPAAHRDGAAWALMAASAGSAPTR